MLLMHKFYASQCSTEKLRHPGFKHKECRFTTVIFWTKPLSVWMVWDVLLRIAICCVIGMTELKCNGFHEFALARHVDLKALRIFATCKWHLDLYSKGSAKYHVLIQLFSIEETIFAHWIEKCPTCDRETHSIGDLILITDIKEQIFG